jgi:hypothetical protein
MNNSRATIDEYFDAGTFPNLSQPQGISAPERCQWHRCATTEPRHHDPLSVNIFCPPGNIRSTNMYYAIRLKRSADTD